MKNTTLLVGTVGFGMMLVGGYGAFPPLLSCQVPSEKDRPLDNLAYKTCEHLHQIMGLLQLKTKPTSSTVIKIKKGVFQRENLMNDNAGMSVA